MTQEEILSNLCYYDSRNPDGVLSDVDEDGQVNTMDYVSGGDGSCYCDNCFYGRTKLAEYILTLNK